MWNQQERGPWAIFPSLPHPDHLLVIYRFLTHNRPFIICTGVNPSSQKVIFQIKYRLRSSPWNKTRFPPGISLHYSFCIPLSQLWSVPSSLSSCEYSPDIYICLLFPSSHLHFQIPLPKVWPRPLNSNWLFHCNYQCDAFLTVLLRRKNLCFMSSLERKLCKDGVEFFSWGE